VNDKEYLLELAKLFKDKERIDDHFVLFGKEAADEIARKLTEIASRMKEGE
jgi:hypothetical protein